MPGLKPIKTIAGEILIYLYDRQRKDPFNLKDELIRFNNNQDTIEIQGQDEFEKVLLAASNDSPADAFNALEYLRENWFIEFTSSPDSGGVSLLNIHVVSLGVDIIEKIEQNEEARKNFNITFNFKLAETISIDALVKNEVESLIKASLL